MGRAVSVLPGFQRSTALVHAVDAFPRTTRKIVVCAGLPAREKG